MLPSLSFWFGFSCISHSYIISSFLQSFSFRFWLFSIFLFITEYYQILNLTWINASSPKDYHHILNKYIVTVLFFIVIIFLILNNFPFLSSIFLISILPILFYIISPKALIYTYISILARERKSNKLISYQI